MEHRWIPYDTPKVVIVMGPPDLLSLFCLHCEQLYTSGRVVEQGREREDPL